MFRIAQADDCDVHGRVSERPGNRKLRDADTALSPKVLERADAGKVFRDCSSRNSGLLLRQSSGANVVASPIVPDSSPWASGP